VIDSVAQRLGGRTSLIGLVTLVVALLAVILNFTGVARDIASSGGKHDETATFRSSQQLTKGNLVRIDGVNVGKVKEIASVDGGRATKVTMSIERSAGNLYADATATLHWRTVLGAAFVVDLGRGHPSDGPLQGGIPVERTTNQIELDDVTSIAQGGAKTGLQRLPHELSQALRDHAVPGKVLDTAADNSPDIETALRALRGQNQDDDLQGLVKGVAKTVDILGRSPEKLRAVVGGAAATLDATGTHAGAIDATLALSPGVMERTDRTLTNLDTTLKLADPLVDRLQDSAPQVGPTLRALNPTVRGADTLLTNATPLLRDLRPAVRSLADTAKRGLPLLTELQPSIDRTQKSILPYLAEKDPGTGKSTTVMIGGTFAGLGAGSAGQMDSNGHFLRFALSVGSAPVYLPCQLYLNNPDKAKQIECEALQETLKRLASYNPLEPAPGTTEGDPPPQRRKR
jgi:ABC-type transporter Mla subunit MlaD